jgi:hypothetical protein
MRYCQQGASRLRQLLVTDDQIALNAVMMKANDKIRLWSLRGGDGSILVADEAFL